MTTPDPHEERLAALLTEVAATAACLSTPWGSLWLAASRRARHRRQRRLVVLPIVVALGLAGVGFGVFSTRSVRPSGTDRLAVGHGTGSPGSHAAGATDQLGPDTTTGTVWPFTHTAQIAAWQHDHGSFSFLTDPARVAQRFVHDYLGLTDATVAAAPPSVTNPVFGENFGRAFVVMLRSGGTALLHVAQFPRQTFGSASPDADRPWLVTATSQDPPQFGPTAEGQQTTDGQLTGSPITVTGTSGGAQVTVLIRDGDNPDQVLGTTTRPVDNGRYGVKADLSTTALPEAVVVVLSKNASGAVTGFTINPVYFAVPLPKASLPANVSSSPLLVAAGTPATPQPTSFIGERRAGNGRIAVISSRTGAVLRYLSGTDQATGPGEVSDDRSRVFYAEMSLSGSRCDSTFWSVPLGGGSATQLDPHQPVAGYSATAPDGTKLAYVNALACQGNEQDALVIRSATGVSKTFPDATDNLFHTFSWSPDGRRLAFDSYEIVADRRGGTRHDGVRILDVASAKSGTPLTQATRWLPPADPGCKLLDPSFVPDSGRLAAGEKCPDGSAWMLVYDDATLLSRTSLGRVQPDQFGLVSFTLDASGQHPLYDISLDSRDATSGVAYTLRSGKPVRLATDTFGPLSW